MTTVNIIKMANIEKEIPLTQGGAEIGYIFDNVPTESKFLIHTYALNIYLKHHMEHNRKMLKIFMANVRTEKKRQIKMGRGCR
jgi:hypothetical protein